MAEQKTRVKLVPPDGGWGYAICCAAIILLVPVSGFRPSFGMIYHDLWEDIGMDTTTMGFCTGATMMISAISAFVASSLLKVLSLRQAALLAATLINVGSFSVAFSNSVTTFFLTQTLIQSAGCGILFNLSYTSIREYFTKRRLMAVSVVQTTIAVSIMCIPMLIKYATEYYGPRGMLIIIAGISLQQFIGASLLQPVAWHMKKVEIPGDTIVEMKTLLTNDKKSDYDVEKLNVKAENKIVSADNAETNKATENITKPDKKSAISVFFNRIVDVELMKGFVLSTPNIALSASTFSSFMYVVMLPRSLYAEVKSHNEVAWALSLIGFGDLGMKITFILFSSLLKKVESRKLHLAGATIAFTARLGFQLTTNSIAKLVFLTLIGIGRCFITVLQPIVIADSVGPTKFTGAIGIHGLTVGVLNLILGPIYGAVRDVTDSYEIVFWIVTATFLGIMILWIIDINKNKRDRNVQK